MGAETRLCYRKTSGNAGLCYRAGFAVGGQRGGQFSAFAGMGCQPERF